MSKFIEINDKRGREHVINVDLIAAMWKGIEWSQADKKDYDTYQIAIAGASNGGLSFGKVIDLDEKTYKYIKTKIL